MMDKGFWKNKRVLITGHTGFKGSWLTLWLHSLGARLFGYGLMPEDDESLYNVCDVSKCIQSYYGDIRDQVFLQKALAESDPEIIFHMAAQSLVRTSYENPIETYEVNVLGTAYLLEVVRLMRTKNPVKPIAIVNVTSDKCYENKEWEWGYRENDSLGGYDPYSNSKACAELVTSSYRSSYFPPEAYSIHKVGLASARAGNVIGGGDWALDRLIPDCVRSIRNGEPIILRKPTATRPWQHVLEPLSGYINLAQKLFLEGRAYASAWNFGPLEKDNSSVEDVVKLMLSIWGDSLPIQIDRREQPHETRQLMLDCSRANGLLKWKPRWDVTEAVIKTIEWYKNYISQKNMLDITLQQIRHYEIS